MSGDCSSGLSQEGQRLHTSADPQAERGRGSFVCNAHRSPSAKPAKKPPTDGTPSASTAKPDATRDFRSLASNFLHQPKSPYDCGRPENNDIDGNKITTAHLDKNSPVLVDV